MRDSKAHFYYLDWMRGGAAFFVLAYHARNLLFLDAGENPRALSLAGKFFYFITGFGHLAVVVFFVLSGCVIARAVISSLDRGNWSWPSYLLSRVTRLWVVLLPGLVLTLLWDTLAWRFFPTALPHSDMNYAHMLAPADREALNGFVLVGNAFFLQTILVPCLGSNGALWSLANEFWYYLIFPLATLFFWGRYSMWTRVLGAGLAVVLLFLTGAKIAGLFPVWLLGAGVFLLWRRGVEPRGGLARWGIWPTALFAAALLSWIRVRAAKQGHASDDIVAGAAVAVPTFLLLFRHPAKESPINQLMVGAANMSFTLYVTHTPVLVLIASFLMRQRAERWPFDGAHLAAFIVILALVTGYAYLIYRFTEAHTAKVRGWIAHGLRLSRGPVPT